MAVSTGVPKKGQQRGGSVKTVGRAIQILNVLAEAGAEVGVVELADRLGASQSTVHRIVSTLLAGDYVAQNPQSGKYELGLGVLTLSGTVLNHLEIRKQAMPVMGRLAAETQCNANLAVLHRGEALYVARVDGPKSALMYTAVGRRAPAHATALGKAILACLPEPEVDEILTGRPLRACTARTLTDHERLREDLERTRQRGYAVDLEEFIQGIRCVAVPIRSAAGAAVGALSLSGSVFQVRDDTVERFGALLQDAAYEISGRLGYIP